MRTLLISIAAGLIFVSSAAASMKPFAELWNNLAYYTTNVEQQDFSALLLRYEGKAGFNVGNSPFDLYGVYYGTASQTSDYWDNSLFYGLGARFRPFYDFKPRDWTNEWLPNVKLFVESLSATYQKNAAVAEAAGLPKNDTRYGVEIWHVWNLDQPNLNDYWGELWTNLAFRTTSFTISDYNDWLFFFQPKIGRHLGRGIEPYVKADLTYSNKNYYWQNVAAFGVGIRFEPWRNTADNESPLKKVKLFAEVLSVSYLKDKPAAAQQTVSSDIRFGIDMSIGR
ncbi:hypothetical protein A3K48_04540 [candidate division WOR-1 bacterium RIFOXYA12_FULL_52_29]|uniref:Outer membrane protein beta-barrel domain-containing protein n=1 Tax=candidate division WOR-1 bacterium RIFOXYC12_FULL_54_18 TaxID=1802584 RepID=A0A1F4T6B0_UNCSA|nr:MAG: hypothetical protein A3K44_04540 [candidate division WOR-1 bacterium RIFOXYA2_FULL_51_19]OGC17817.1 MAG: hypothetical protein A3K48_04540 [candidate division WOR-1 bacterium RIFOXYA12_FULL_52_29]OGC26674.1 MAG: hypothetical protein A3K32_04535 [candidate division WOR-1 bacterium RIFOXYB2_FULL_45_9]OGC28234.1 MAG: hypothetical protein A3K49_04540 [candidate division WOR-1 bacterium RIFOXYC12_FULL_54_18]OGC29478.1 MAG: hypothetical protein A2346_01795 [candidate division WOR-1 bacterium R